VYEVHHVLLCEAIRELNITLTIHHRNSLIKQR